MIKSNLIWKYACLLFFALLAMGQLQRVDLPGWPAFYVHDMVLLVFVSSQLLRQSGRDTLIKAVRRIPKLAWVWLGWISLGWLLAVFQQQSISYSLLSFARLGLYVISGVYLYQLVKARQLTPFWLSFCLSLFFGLLLYFGLIQYAFLPDTRFLFFVGWDDHLHRLISTIFDPGFTGLLLGLGFVFFQQSRSLTSRWLLFGQPVFLWLLSLAMAVGVLLTYSRASYLALAVSLLLLVVATWQARKIQLTIFYVVMMGLFVVGVLNVPRPGGEGVRLERTSTITARTETIQTAVLSLSQPIDLIVGQGLLTPLRPGQPSIYTGGESHARVADNWLIMLMTGTGIVGLGLSLGLLAKLLCWAKAKPDSLLWVGLIATAVHGLFNASISYPFVWIAVVSWGVITLGKRR